MQSERSRERGIASIIVALGLVALAGLGALAVDYGYLQVKRSQLQTSADAASVAGAAALISYRGNPAAVRDAALAYARRNIAMDDKPTLAAQDADVKFFRNGTADTTNPNQVQIGVGLTQARGNPVRLFLASALGIASTDLSASSRASLYGVSSSTCMKPFIVPTKFTWNDACDPNKAYSNNGQLDTGSACEMASVKVLGYGPSDVGTEVTLKVGSPQSAIAPSIYNAIDLPAVNRGAPVTGASSYRDNIAGCNGTNSTTVAVGDEIALETGNMSGPTKQGADELIALDPNAYWDTATKSIKGSSFPDPLSSPRVGFIPFYDPSKPPVSGRNSLFVYQLGALFIEGDDGNGNVRGRFIQSMASHGGGTDPNSMLFAVRLVLDSSRGAQ